MAAPEDRPDSPDVLDPHGNARLLGLSPRVVGDPARFADIYDKSGTFGVAWTVRGLAARLAAAEARLEAVVRAAEDVAWRIPSPFAGNVVSAVRAAALSAAPQPAAK